MNRRMLFTVLCCVSSVQAVWQDKTFLQDGQLTETDQYVQVFVYDSPPVITNIVINGGQIGTLFTHDNSRTVISGGTFSDEYYQYHPENNDGDNVILAPYESRVYTYDQSTVIYNNGSLANIECDDWSNLTVGGGNCSISALENSTVNITGGVINDITTMDDLLQAEVNSKFYLTGGTFPGTVFLTDDSEMHIYGYGFAYNPNGQISTVKGGILQVGILNGFWGNDTPFEINFLDRFSENSYDHVYLHPIPEPVTLLIFILGAVAMRKIKGIS